MKTALLCLLLLAALSATPLQAMTWSELEAEINTIESGQPGNPEIIMRFAEMVNMLVSYTRQLHEAELSPLICPPRGVPMHSDQLISIVRARARQTDAAPDTLVQDLLLDGFRTEFPCN